MSQKFDREVEVMIWPYNSVKHFGHVAVKLRGISPQNGARYAYISYWPTEGAAIWNAPRSQPAGLNPDAKTDGLNEMSSKVRIGLATQTMTPRANQKLMASDKTTNQIIYKTSAEDIDVNNEFMVSNGTEQGWVQRPEFRIHLPALGAQGQEFGLDVDRIYSWFESYVKNPNPRYRLASTTRNCAAVAVLALRAGGASHYASMPSARVYYEPNQVLHWARALENVFTKLNNASQVGTSAPGYFPSKATELMSFATWQTKSKQGVSRFTHRPAQIKKIDAYLQAYFKAGTWLQAGSEKRALLGNLACEIHEYLASNFNAKRETAVLELGEQIRNVLKLHRANEPLEWLEEQHTFEQDWHEQLRYQGLVS